MPHIIDQKLQNIACPLSLFVSITGGLIGRTRLTEGLKKDNLDRALVDKLVALVDEMAELKRASLIAPDWSDAEGIRTQLQNRRVKRDIAQYDLGEREQELLHGTTKTDEPKMDESVA